MCILSSTEGGQKNGTLRSDPTPESLLEEGGTVSTQLTNKQVIMSDGDKSAAETKRGHRETGAGAFPPSRYII